MNQINFLLNDRDQFRGETLLPRIEPGPLVYKSDLDVTASAWGYMYL